MRKGFFEEAKGVRSAHRLCMIATIFIPLLIASYTAITTKTKMSIDPSIVAFAAVATGGQAASKYIGNKPDAIPAPPEVK